MLFPRRKWGPSRAWHGVAWCVGGLVAFVAQASAQPQTPPKKAASSTAAQSETTKSGATGGAAGSGKAKPATDKADLAPDVQAHAPAAADPDQMRKISPNEVFRDPRAEALLDVNKFKHEKYPLVGREDTDALKEMAGNVNAALDKDLITRVINSQVSVLTDHQNIHAVIDELDDPKNVVAKKRVTDATHAINEATTTLLEPIFSAKSIKNLAFLAAYSRALIDRLSPVLKNHLIPRIQAMIVLGELGSPDALKVYKDQLNDRNQTVWVKLWALEGIVNIVEDGISRISGQAQVDAAKVVADFLEKDENIPWPVQLRAMEALAALRYGYDPTRPKRAEMANAAMRVLADSQAKPEVRAEAARALGMMQVDSTVPKYNYSLIAHSTGQLAVDLGLGISAYQNQNDSKPKYLSALLIGPLYQAFDGVAGARDSGLVHNARPEAAPYVRKVFDAIKPVLSASLDLINSGQRQVKDRQATLLKRIEALKAFLAENEPPDRHLVAGGPEFAAAMAPQAEIKAPDANLAGRRRNGP
jgi:hypothetical protein